MQTIVTSGRRAWRPAPGPDVEFRPMGRGMGAATLALAMVIWAGATPTGAAASSREYVLRHPHREHCKSGYDKKVRHIKRRVHGHLVRVAETICVKGDAPKLFPAPQPPAPPVIPTPAPEAPPVPIPPAPFSTSTVLNLSEPEECGSTTWDLGASWAQYCLYTMTATVMSAGPPPTSTAVNYVFEPHGESRYSAQAVTPVTVKVIYEKEPSREGTLVIDTSNGVVLAHGPGVTDFHVYASYIHALGYESSQSTSGELHS